MLVTNSCPFGVSCSRNNGLITNNGTGNVNKQPVSHRGWDPGIEMVEIQGLPTES